MQLHWATVHFIWCWFLHFCVQYQINKIFYQFQNFHWIHLFCYQIVECVLHSDAIKMWTVICWENICLFLICSPNSRFYAIRMSIEYIIILLFHLFAVVVSLTKFYFVVHQSIPMHSECIHQNQMKCW